MRKIDTEQMIYYKDYLLLKQWINSKRVFLVCGKSFDSIKILYEIVFGNVVRFSDFNPNPTYESVVKGISLFKETDCDAMVAIGGGSAIDVAKCIKAFMNSENYASFHNVAIMPGNIPFMAIPTTAGTGSESTCFAVIYHEDKKYSIEDKACLPNAVILDSDLLSGLPIYQRKVTALDALCHAIEAYWSVKATEESMRYSEVAIRNILKNMKAYIDGDIEATKEMLYAANMAGKAINIARTTAGHAMSYKLTSMYGIAHGHAVALCVAVVWRYLVDTVNKRNGTADSGYIYRKLEKIAVFFGVSGINDAVDLFDNILMELAITAPKINEVKAKELASTVNTDRLENFPVRLNNDDIIRLYLEL